MTRAAATATATAAAVLAPAAAQAASFANGVVPAAWSVLLWAPLLIMTAGCALGLLALIAAQGPARGKAPAVVHRRFRPQSALDAERRRVARRVPDTAFQTHARAA